jgi:hypothetical protein
MPTTNLIQRTLGTSFFESGNGVPDHTSTRGSIYIDADSGLSYINRSLTSSGNTWSRHFGSNFRGGILFSGNSTTLTNSTSGWVEFNQTGLFSQLGTIENLDVIQVSPQDYRLRVLNAGTYYILFCASTAFATGNTNNLSLGVSINQTIPNNSDFRRKLSNSTPFTSNSLGLSVVKTLSANDTISVTFNNGGQNLLLTDASIYVYQF